MLVRGVGVAAALSAVLIGQAGVRIGSTGRTLRFVISVPADKATHPLDGRVLLFVSDDARSEPRFQTDQYRANSTRPIFGVDVDGYKAGDEVVVDDRVVGWPARSVRDIPAGDYVVQAMFLRYETFHRADGRTVKLPMDRGEGQQWARKPGNFFSRPARMHLDPASGEAVRIAIDQEIPPIDPPKDTAQVKYLRVPNQRLSAFWGRPVDLGAIVLLPQEWDAHPAARYPIVVHHGHFPPTMESDGWRETPPDPAATGQQREAQQAAYTFYQAWNAPNFPG